MRLPWVTVALLALAQGALCAQAQPSPQPIPAGQLFREVVFNELRDHGSHGYWRYWVQRQLQQETRLEDQVETAQGPIARLSLSNGHPLSAESRQQEQARLKRLLNSPGEQAKLRQGYDEDEKQIGWILALLPDAFLFAYDGDENGCHRLRFRPNPDHPGHSSEARILRAMAGTLWIDAGMKRLVRLDVHIEDDVAFGYGILGRLNKGGWFQLQRVQVSPTDWKTERIEVHLFGRALCFKTFARETSEVRGGFVPVPAAMNLAQGMALLEQTQAQAQAQAPPAQPVAQIPARTALIAPPIFAVHP